jgi:hypothetical protein
MRTAPKGDPFSTSGKLRAVLTAVTGAGLVSHDQPDDEDVQPSDAMRPSSHWGAAIYEP